MPGERPELSDVAAILVASGYLTPTGRAIVIRRVSTGLPLPIVPGGFGEMRRLQRAIVQLEAQQSVRWCPV